MIYECIGCGRPMQANHSNPKCIKCIRSGKLEGKLDLVPIIVVPVPYENWPKWTKLIARLKVSEDKGVGDTTQRILSKVGGERYKTFTKKLGIPCGCNETQNKWNMEYPYENSNLFLSDKS